MSGGGGYPATEHEEVKNYVRPVISSHRLSAERRFSESSMHSIRCERPSPPALDTLTVPSFMKEELSAAGLVHTAGTLVHTEWRGLCWTQCGRHHPVWTDSCHCERVPCLLLSVWCTQPSRWTAVTARRLLPGGAAWADGAAMRGAARTSLPERAATTGTPASIQRWRQPPRLPPLRPVSAA